MRPLGFTEDRGTSFRMARTKNWPASEQRPDLSTMYWSNETITSRGVARLMTTCGSRPAV
jgi:hypothetical protein